MNFHSLGESKCSLLTLPVWDPASLRTRNTVVSLRFSKKEGHGKQLGARNNQLKYRTMTQKRIDKGTQEIKAMMAEDTDFYVRLCAL